MFETLDWIGLRRDLAMFVLPPFGFVVLALIGLLLRRRRAVLGGLLAWTGVLALAITSMPFVANALLHRFADLRPIDLQAARTAGAIVILGGGLRPDAGEYGGDTLGRWTLERVRYGAFVAKHLALPVLVTGGPGSQGGLTEGAAMTSALQNEYGVDVRWREEASRNTRENATLSAPLLRAAGITRIVLVTHAYHMTRARAEFEARGFDVVPAATFVPRGDPLTWHDFIPRVGALEQTHLIVYEWLSGMVGGTPPTISKSQ